MLSKARSSDGRFHQLYASNRTFSGVAEPQPSVQHAKHSARAQCGALHAQFCSQTRAFIAARASVLSNPTAGEIGLPTPL